MNMETRSLNKLEAYLDVVARREQLVASNIANIDTPGYRTQDIDFKSALNHAMKQTSTLPVEAQEVDGLVERPDGNNVNLDRESMLLAETQLQFRAGTSLLRREFHNIELAIHDGRTA